MDRHFALFCDKQNVIWTFGDMTDEFSESCTRFLNGLDSIGHELFGEGIASIKLDPPVKGGDKPEEIFCLTLARRFYFIVSDPLFTLRLMEFSEIPTEFQENIEATLAGQALMIYANLYEKLEERSEEIDELFHSALRDAGIWDNLEDYAGKGRCSLSGLTVRQLCLFHYFLRERFEKNPEILSQKPWAIINAKNGTPVHLKHNQSIDRALIIAGYLSVIYTFVEDLFMSLPTRIIFGGEVIVSLDTFTGKKNFLSISSWESVLKDKEFLGKFVAIPQEVVQDLHAPFTQFLAQKLSEEFFDAVTKYPLLDLLNFFRNANNIREVLPLMLMGAKGIRRMLGRID
ncbi:MAG: hypothetical protein ACFFD4_38740 [Candidatus Odinarchaeota archaeon]